MRLVLLLLPLAVGCKKGNADDAQAGPYDLLEEGDGDVLLVAEEPLNGAIYHYHIDSRTTISITTNEGFLDHNGTALLRRVTTDEVVYRGFSEDAALFFGTDTFGLLDEGVVTLSYPIMAGRRWTSGTPDFPDMFEYHVIGPEVIETPAGYFDAVRVDQLNRVDDIDSSRWYAPGVGMVHRIASARTA